MIESSVMTSEYPQSHRGRCALDEISNVRGSKAQDGPRQDRGNDKTHGSPCGPNPDKTLPSPWCCDGGNPNETVAAGTRSFLVLEMSSGH
jgi:hypothetical protein